MRRLASTLAARFRSLVPRGLLPTTIIAPVVASMRTIVSSSSGSTGSSNQVPARGSLVPVVFTSSVPRSFPCCRLANSIIRRFLAPSVLVRLRPVEVDDPDLLRTFFDQVCHLVRHPLAAHRRAPSLRVFRGIALLRRCVLVRGALRAFSLLCPSSSSTSSYYLSRDPVVLLPVVDSPSVTSPCLSVVASFRQRAWLVPSSLDTASVASFALLDSPIALSVSPLFLGSSARPSVIG